MISYQNIPGPICNKCEQCMRWASEQIVDLSPVQVFHCETCDKYAAASLGLKGFRAAAASGL
jgi:hypothetical protein